jgi:hypothetical protein
MNWPHRYVVVTPAVIRESVRMLFASVSPAGNAELAALTVPLSATGQEPVTHYAADVPATEQIRTALEMVEAAGQVPTGVYYWRCDNTPERVLRSTNHPPSAPLIGQSLTFATAVTAGALIVIVS